MLLKNSLIHTWKNFQALLSYCILLVAISGTSFAISPGAQLNLICDSKLLDYETLEKMQVKDLEPFQQSYVTERLVDFSAPILEKAQLAKVHPDLYYSNPILVLKYLAFLNEQRNFSKSNDEEFFRTVKTICSKKWGVTNGMRFESVLSTVSGATFLLAFITNLAVAAPAAPAIFAVSAVVGGSAYILSAQRKTRELLVEKEIFELSESAVRKKSLSILGDLALGLSYGLIVANGASLTKEITKIEKARKTGKTIKKSYRGWKLLIPNFNTFDGKFAFITTLFIRTWTTTEKMQEYGVKNPYVESTFYTDLVVNYFVALLNGNYGEALKHFQLGRVLGQSAFVLGGQVLVENWATNFQQAIGNRVNSRYRDFAIGWTVVEQLPRRLIATPIEFTLRKIGPDGVGFLLAGLFKKVGILLPENSAYSSAMARYVFQDKGFFQAISETKFRDLLPWSLKKNKEFKPMSATAALELIDAWQ